MQRKGPRRASDAQVTKQRKVPRRASDAQVNNAKCRGAHQMPGKAMQSAAARIRGGLDGVSTSPEG
eukprot:9407007-Pyramimonas_sp.AAC.1